MVLWCIVEFVSWFLFQLHEGVSCSAVQNHRITVALPECLLGFVRAELQAGVWVVSTQIDFILLLRIIMDIFTFLLRLFDLWPVNFHWLHLTENKVDISIRLLSFGRLTEIHYGFVVIHEYERIKQNVIHPPVSLLGTPVHCNENI